MNDFSLVWSHSKICFIVCAIFSCGRAMSAEAEYNNDLTQTLGNKILVDKALAKKSRSDSLARMLFQQDCLALALQVAEALEVPKHAKKLGPRIGDALEACVDPILERGQTTMITYVSAEFWIAAPPKPEAERALWWLYVGDHVAGKPEKSGADRKYELETRLGPVLSAEIKREAIKWTNSR